MGKTSMEELYCGEIKQPQETHAACVFAVDISDSMNYPRRNSPINSLNESLRLFKEQACTDEVSKNVIDVAVVSFGGHEAKVVSKFTPIVDFVPPRLSASGATPMGQGLELAVKMAKARAKQYQDEGTDAHIPWVVMITDGVATDSLERAKALIREEEAKGKYGHVRLWIVAVDGADLRQCKDLTKRVLYVKDKDYRPIFDWTRKSMAIMSVSSPGVDKVKLPSIPQNTQIVPDDWVD